ncbi:MAG: energy transducer TonB [Acidobacteria bacterium]|nr:energy transducer TonB [Acidobacteriota bacterium]
MTTEVIRTKISAYIDGALNPSERDEVARLIKENSTWEQEYKAIKKTAEILSQLDRLSAPEDLVHKVNRSIALSKKGLLNRFNDHFTFTLTRSPVFQYLALIVALVVIVFSGSLIILKDNIFKNDQTARMLKETDWVDKKVKELDKQIAKDGYKWMHLRINDDGTVEVRHIGEKEPEAANEDDFVAENKPIRQLKGKDLTREKSPTASSMDKKENLTKKSSPRLNAPVRMNEDKKDTKAAEEEQLHSLGYLSDSSKSEVKEELAVDSAIAAKSDKEKAQSDKERAEDRLAAAKAAPPTKTEPAMEGSSRMKVRRKTSIPGRTQVAESQSETPAPAPDKNIQIEITQYPTLIKIGKLHKADLRRIKQDSITAILTIDPEGIVESAELLEGTGIESIDQRVITLLEKAKFEPAYTKDGPVSYTFKIKLDLK